MRALITTLTFAVIQPSTQRELAHIARDFGSVDGHISAIWMRNGNRIALHQVFDSLDHADCYLEGALFDRLASLDAVRDVFIEEYNIVEGLTAIGERLRAEPADARVSSPIG